MKKLGFIMMPLMAVSLLASCGGSNPKPQVVEHFVSFDSKGGDYVKTQRVKDGDTATEPNPEPTRDNDEFKGWFADDTYQKPYMFTESVTDDVTLYAKWHEIEGTTFTVTFMNGDSEYKKIEGIEPKQHISSPGSPTKDHYNFIGWCTDAEGKNKFDFAKIEINQNYTLYAGYEKNCTIIFKNKGEDYASAEAIKGTAIPGTQLPSDPTNPPVPGQTFIGWGTDTTAKHIINDLAAAKFYEETTTLHANWISEPIPVTTYTINFNCTNCKVYDETGTTEITSSIDVTMGHSYTMYCKFIIKGKDDYKSPFSKSSITVKKTSGGEAIEFYYDGKTCEITVPVPADLTIAVSGVNKTLEQFTWPEINEISTLGRADEFFDIYDPEYPELNCKKVQLSHQDLDKDGEIDANEVYQTVRIIAFNEDYTELPEGGGTPDPSNAIGITFEFADLISDDLGYSLATQWNDTNTTDGSNHNYLDSSVRMALVGEKQDKGHILWAQKEATAWSNEEGGTYTNKSVLKMLPDELKKEGILKTPAKYININDGNGWKEEIVKDKLFLLSPVEMGKTSHQYEEEHTTTYSYYDGATDAKRVKKQIKGDDIYTYVSEIPDDKGQSYLNKVYNNAGYNSKSDATEGGQSWLRSPKTNNSSDAWRVCYDGRFTNYYYGVYGNAFAVAPAFCI